jgi:hypothetical protein
LEKLRESFFLSPNFEKIKFEELILI